MNLPAPPEPPDPAPTRPIGPAIAHEVCGPEWQVEKIVDGEYAIWIHTGTNPPMRRCIPLRQP